MKKLLSAFLAFSLIFGISVPGKAVHADPVESAEETTETAEEGSPDGETSEGETTEPDTPEETPGLSEDGEAVDWTTGNPISDNDRIHYLVLDDLKTAKGTDKAPAYRNSSDAILIESNGHYGLVDTSNPGSAADDYPASAWGTSMSSETANGGTVLSYLKKLGVRHLDFILATHSHSDHIGGVKVLAEDPAVTVNEVRLVKNPDYDPESDADEDLNPEYLTERIPHTYKMVDQSTVYFYKEYQEVKAEENQGWENAWFYSHALYSMQSAGAETIDVSKAVNEEASLSSIGAVYYSGADAEEDYISLPLGDFTLSFLNLYTESQEDENANSILTFISGNGVNTLLAADYDVFGGQEKNMADFISGTFGKVNVLKAGHHGYEKSTSRYWLDTLNPGNVVLSTCYDNYGDLSAKYSPFYGYLKKKGIPVYRTMDQKIALVEDCTGGTAALETYTTGETPENQIPGAQPSPWKYNGQRQWAHWYYDWEHFDWLYIQNDGTYTTGWVKVPQAGTGVMRLYYFNDDGIMQTGWQNRDGKKLYLDPDVNKGWAVTGWQQISGKTYYFSPYDYSALTGMHTIDGSLYVFDDTGVMETGWVTVQGTRRYFGTDGKGKTGWVALNGSWYFLSLTDGRMLTGWQYISGTWYYLTPGSGKMLTGWQAIGGKWYYMDGDGKMYAHRWKDGFWLDDGGVMASGYTGKWYRNGKGWWFEDTTGWYPVSKWQNINGFWYYFNAAGYMVTGWQFIKGFWYYLVPDGMMQTGWIDAGNTWYYCADGGEMVTGWLHLYDTWYYMLSDGSLGRGWQYVDGKWYFMIPNGNMVTGRQWINGKEYGFDENGALLD